MLLQASTPRVALITGAAQGIGKAIALRLASDGYKVAVNDIHSKVDQLDFIAEDIKKTHGIQTCTVPGDVSVEHEVESMVGNVAKTLGCLDIMVANAAILGPPDNEEDWDKILRVNAKGVFLCYKHAAKQMIAQGRPGGRIIGASSIVGKQGMVHLGAYSASKFAIRGLTQVAALEFGHHGITVNAYAPGAIESPMGALNANLKSSTTAHFKHIAHAADLATSPVSKSLPSFSTLGKGEDIASLVSYLASQESGYITGELHMSSKSAPQNVIPFILLSKIGINLFADLNQVNHDPWIACPSIPRVALITGAAQGIGKAIALRLASDGFKVAINDIHSKADQLESVAEDIKKTHGIATCAVPGDVGVEHEVEGMVGTVAKTLGSLDVVGYRFSLLILSKVEEEWDKVQRINTKGVFLCYKHAAKQMIAQGRPGGRIIGASSVAGKQGMIHVGAYIASKFAVRGLTQVAALEFGHHGITVNAYAPGGCLSSNLHVQNSTASSFRYY
ncbi:NAD(P)-binding protein [Lentinula raphanica]|nr:NAD(P)-binding protein [Lentinula raphanica]